MNKLLLGLTVSLIALGGASPAANAETTCTISGTGPDSHNTCDVKDKFTCEVKNNTDIIIYNDNGQQAGSGSAAVGDNTTSGSATSGSASNSNGTKFDVAITNGGCVVTAVVTPPTPVTPSVVTPSGGQGAVVAPVAAPAGRGAVAALPNTSAESTMAIVAGLVTLLAATILGSRFAVAAYSNIKS